jgi:hypothetical protein
LSIQYIGRAPNVAEALKPRREEAGIALATIVRDPNCNRKARYRALYLISDMGFPQAREVLLSVIDDEDLQPDVARLLGKRQDPGNSDVLLKLYASGGKGRPDPGSTILDALTAIGDARVLPLLDAQIARTRAEAPSERVRFLEGGVDAAQVEEMLQSWLDGLLNKRKLVELANARDPVAATVPLLYESSFSDRVWAIHFLERLNPPTLPAHLRASYEIFKSKGKDRWDPHFYEHELLTVLDRIGGPLTPSERAYLTAWDNWEGCIPPPKPD